MRNAPQAFRHLREGRNVGKVVLSVPPRSTPSAPCSSPAPPAASAPSSPVTWSSATAPATCSWSAAAVPRREGAAELQAELEELGAEATIAACDVSDREALEKLLASIPESAPLGAVIHCAGALADGTVETLDPEQIERVFAPKVDAAWNLHELTAGLDLSAFVLFSSAAGILGGPGQANYAAANVFLDALAQKRQAPRACPPPRSPGACGSARAA